MNPIYYVNGIATTPETAIQQLDMIREVLPDRELECFYNDSVPQELVKASSSSAIIEGLLTWKNDGFFPGLFKFIEVAFQGGATTFAYAQVKKYPLAAKLAGKVKQYLENHPKERVTLLPHSQGVRIVYNALKSLRGDSVAQRIHVLAVGGLGYIGRDLAAEAVNIVNGADGTPTFFGGFYPSSPDPSVLHTDLKPNFLRDLFPFSKAHQLSSYVKNQGFVTWLNLAERNFGPTLNNRVHRLEEEVCADTTRRVRTRTS